jgi:ring-1,2-phenylacetyl-CoA epoxidase subunit PaaD
MSAERIELISEARFDLNRTRQESACRHLFDALDDVKDPEIPVMSIWDLGVLQNIERRDNQVRVTITPTYSGCPAIGQIEQDIVARLAQAGEHQVEILMCLSPAWSTELLSQATKARLQKYGVSPPGSNCCPQCGSEDIEVISEFSSTACKALHRCRSCLEPFDHFKTL